jgi:hypothetical protein
LVTFSLKAISKVGTRNSRTNNGQFHVYLWDKNCLYFLLICFFSFRN